MQLLTPTEPLAVVDPQTGSSRILRRLTTVGGDFMDRVYVTGGRLVWNGPRGTYAIDTDLRSRPQGLGARHRFMTFIASATPGRIWFSYRERGQPQQLIEMTVRGRVTRRLEAPSQCRFAIAVALESALLCQDPNRDRLLAIDRVSGERRTYVPGVFPLAAADNVVASCRYVCRALQITDVVAPRHLAIPAPRGYRYVEGYDGAFSRDGALLAVPVKPRRGGVGQVALIDVQARAARVIPGSRLGAYRKFTWSSAGELFFPSRRGQIMSFKPRERRAHLLPVNFHLRILDLAAN